MPAFPGDTPIQLLPTSTYINDGVANHSLCGSLHMGTHIDAPGHFTDKDKKIIDFPISKFIGKAIVIDAINMPEIGIDRAPARLIAAISS